MNISKKSILKILAFFCIYLIWGSTYLLNKVAVTELPPFYTASIRFAIAGLLIFIIAKALGKPLKISIRQYKNCVISGFLFLVYGNGAFIWALKYVDSGFAALIAAIQPLFVVILMRIIDKKSMRLKSLIGITLGIIGMCILVSQKELITNSKTILGIFMMLTAVLGWSYGSIFVSKAHLPTNFFVSTAYQMVTAGVILAVLSFCVGEPWVSPLTWSIRAQWAVGLLIVLGGIVAFTAFNYLLKEVSTEKVATSAYVNPVIAIFLGWLILGEKIALQTIIATLILLTGVYFINTRKS